MYPIDEFNYTVLLAALEKIKGTKELINKFIKKMYADTDNLSSIDINSLRYAFMIITKAIEYSTAVNKCSSVIKKRLEDVATILTDHITAENVIQTFEFWYESLRFNPKCLSDLKRIDGVLRTIKQSSNLGRKIEYRIYNWCILEIKHLDNSKRDFAIRMFINSTIGMDSPILEKIPNTASNFDPTILITSFEETISNLQIILKETNEYISRSSTTN